MIWLYRAAAGGQRAATLLILAHPLACCCSEWGVAAYSRISFGTPPLYVLPLTPARLNLRLRCTHDADKKKMSFRCYIYFKIANIVRPVKAYLINAGFV